MNTLVILCDVEKAISECEELNEHGMAERLSKIVIPFRIKLQQSFANIHFISYERIKAYVDSSFPTNQFYVGLDDSVYFTNCHFNFSITRVATQKNNIRKGPYIYTSRKANMNFQWQLQDLLNTYNKSSRGKPITLCDDIIGHYGSTITKVVDLFTSINLNISAIRSVISEKCTPSLLGIRIHSLYDYRDNIYAINERDLYWGLPRSGINFPGFTSNDEFLGVPHTIDEEMINNKICDMKGREKEFRDICLDYNILFWQQLEDFAGRKLLFSDSPRLSRLPYLVSLNSNHIVDSIQSIREYKADL